MKNIILEQFVQTSNSAAGQLKVRSALNPMLWLCAFSSPTALGAAHLIQTPWYFPPTLLVVAIIPPVITCVMYIYFAVNKPEKLQSEEFQIRHQAMDLIQKKGMAAPISPKDIKAIANPNSQRKLGRNK